MFDIKRGSYYIGFDTGVFRIFPGFGYKVDGDMCEKYDPRFRPW